jgi:hypothetical protein
MHEKLVRQLRNVEHCSGCPYDEDCNEFDSCLMDLLAADAIEDMSKRISILEKEFYYRSYLYRETKNALDRIVFPQTIGNITYYSSEELIEWVKNQQLCNRGLSSHWE